MNGHEAAVMTKGRSSKSRAPNPLRTARAVEKTPQRATHTFVLTLSNLEETQTSANISTDERNVCVRGRLISNLQQVNMEKVIAMA